ncbi:hypothetical protein YPPY99_4564, partial [Yersinia pestis PY-99]
MAGGLSPR